MHKQPQGKLSTTLIQEKIKQLLDVTSERSPYIKGNLYQSQSQQYTKSHRHTEQNGIVSQSGETA